MPLLGIERRIGKAAEGMLIDDACLSKQGRRDDIVGMANEGSLQMKCP